MASSRKHSHNHPVRTLVLCLLAVCIVAAATAFGVLYFKGKKVAQGAEFQFSYTITPTTTEAPVLYSVLEKTGTTQGTLNGIYEPGKLLVSLYQQQSAAEPFTRVYIDSSETLYDVGQLYDAVRAAIVDAYPLADAILPAWTLGSYISQTQLAALLGVETGSVEMQDMTGFAFALGALRPTKPEGAMDGYYYFRLDNTAAGENAPELVLGVPLNGLFASETPLHILLAIPEHGVKAELSGTVTAAETTVLAPESRMKDEDIAVFAQIRQTVEQLMALGQQVAG